MIWKVLELGLMRLGLEERRRGRDKYNIAYDYE
jgi:hypothetical protein